MTQSDCNPGRWTDALVAGRWSRLWREWQAARDGDDPTSWKELVTTTVRPLTPRPLRKAIHRAMHGPMPFPWLSEDFVRASDVHERLRQPPVRAGGSFAARGMLQAVRCGASLFAYEDLERLAARRGTDERLPYFDRRIVAFALSIPEHIRTRPRRSKWIAREAFRSELPDAVVNPPEPPDYTFLIVDALEAMGGAPRLADLEIARLGWVNGDLVAAMATRCLSTARTSREHLGDAWRLWSVLAVDEWYRRALPARADTDQGALPLRVRFG